MQIAVFSYPIGRGVNCEGEDYGAVAAVSGYCRIFVNTGLCVRFAIDTSSVGIWGLNFNEIGRAWLYCQIEYCGAVFASGLCEMGVCVNAGGEGAAVDREAVFVVNSVFADKICNCCCDVCIADRRVDMVDDFGVVRDSCVAVAAMSCFGAA